MTSIKISSDSLLRGFTHRDETPAIGTRFLDPQTTQLSQWIEHPNADALLKDLATLISLRGVVFFPAQDIDLDQQKKLALRLGGLSGRPATSSLHKHPISPDTPELGKDVSVIVSTGGIARAAVVGDTRASNGWHTDISFEKVPADYSILKMHTVPPVGGDTLWASGYEAYDKLSPQFAKFLEGLTALHSAQYFVPMAAELGLSIQDDRGSPENSGSDLTAVHPVIRTHPLTGFKTVFINKSFTSRIMELTTDESDDIVDYLTRNISENHDLQVRHRWNPDDVAIWDNRCALHTATNDYGSVHREGYRVVGIGEKPFFDPQSRSRREALRSQS